MERTAINPTSWSTGLGFDQGQLVDGAQRYLFCSGQDSVDELGEPTHPGDMSAQLTTSLDNLEAVLHQAGMTYADVVRLTAYTTSVGELFANWSLVTQRFAEGSGFTTSVLGVSELAAPGIAVLLEATAAA